MQNIDSPVSILPAAAKRRVQRGDDVDVNKNKHGGVWRLKCFVEKNMISIQCIFPFTSMASASIFPSDLAPSLRRRVCKLGNWSLSWIFRKWTETP